MLPPRPLSQREHPHAGTDGRVSPSLISLKYCYVPLSGRGPPIAHDVRLETRALFAFTIDTCIADSQAEHQIYPLALRLVAEGRVKVVGDQAITDGTAVPSHILYNPPHR